MKPPIKVTIANLLKCSRDFYILKPVVYLRNRFWLTGEYNKFSTAKFYILYIRIVLLPFRYYNPWTFHLTWLRCSHRNYHCCSYYVVSNDLAEYVLSTTQLFSSTHNFARSWDGNSCIIIYMIQGEEKNGATIIIDTFNARLYLWNSQSDCKPYVALLYQFFHLLFVFSSTPWNTTIIINMLGGSFAQNKSCFTR